MYRIVVWVEYWIPKHLDKSGFDKVVKSGKLLFPHLNNLIRSFKICRICRLLFEANVRNLYLFKSPSIYSFKCASCSFAIQFCVFSY